MTRLQAAIDKRIECYSNILERWDSASTHDIFDIAVSGKCDLKPLFSYCRSLPCPAREICGEQIVQPVNHHWKSDSVRDNFAEILKLFTELRERVVRGEI
ncbi:hypothetical protein LCGC14_1481440 [marine sediment metagenome]|uniref:Uncharacterized protein n=1 Tax=marine sediment metagenome TaxID=412755 RepID=A0A0F9JA35_9ZZZZ